MNKVRLMVALIAVACCAWVGYGVAQGLWLQHRPVRELSTPLLEPVKSTSDFLCQFDSVSVSPLGKAIVLERGVQSYSSTVHEGRDLAFVSIPCIKKSKDWASCNSFLTGLDGIRVLNWGENASSVTLVENHAWLTSATFDADSDEPTLKISKREPVNPVAAQTRVQYGTFPQTIASLKADVDPAGQQLLGYFVLDSDPIGSIAADLNTASVFLSGSGKQYATKLLPAEAIGLRMASLTSGRWAAVGSGLRVDLETGAQNNDDYGDPVIEKQTARFLGRIAMDGFHVDPDTGENQLSLVLGQAINRALGAHPSSFLVGAAADASGVAAFVLKDWEGNKTIEIVHPNGNSQLQCGRSEAPLRANVTTRYIHMGRKHWPVLAANVSRADGAGPTVVIFSGGPAGDIGRIDFISSVRKYIQRGFNVFVIAYSGSLGMGADISERLRPGVVEALETDAEVVAEYLARRGYKDIVIHGESLGAIPAAALAKHWRSSYKLVFLAPLLKYRNPDEWVGKVSTKLKSIKVSTQRKFEQAMFGVTAETSAKLDSAIENFWLSANSASRNALFIFASDDPVSQISDMQGNTMDGRTVVTVNGIHAVISALSSTWSAVDDFLKMH